MRYDSDMGFVSFIIHMICGLSLYSKIVDGRKMIDYEIQVSSNISDKEPHWLFPNGGWGVGRTAGARAPPPFRRRVTSRAARCQGGRKYCAGREGLQRKQPGWGPLAQGTPSPDDLF
ncbi:hypothetical protein CEXT_413401 [Caerostris extrusa]|uniref:Uncharacterized protein n=1 Tax=Caerostris extrusa TaxID=172846 RepID=A0AAV4N1M0_CAEEX|nr:hypothetical protein CEXT_413401 [Caerostris extrusa]